VALLFLTFTKYLQQLTHARAGTTWAAPMSGCTSCEQVYIHEHTYTQIHAPISRYVKEKTLSLRHRKNGLFKNTIPRKKI
jgi:hypothetical protein